jgi:hypothetical protein
MPPPTRARTPKRLARKRERYDEQRPRLQAALDHWYRQCEGKISDRLSIRALAEQYDVRKSQLHKLTKQGVRRVPEKKPGRQPTLSFKLLCMLAVFIIVQQAVGYAVTRKEIKQKAAELHRIEHPESAPMQKSVKWLKNFFARFPFLSPRKVSNLENDRAKSANPTNVRRFFDLLTRIVKKLGIVTIWNMDESAIQCSNLNLDDEVIGLKGSRNAYRPTSNFKEHVTILDAVSSNGETIPPLIIFKGVNIPEAILQNGPDGARVAFTPKGWTNEQIFNLWMDHFISHTNAYLKPILLLVDGHGSHYFPTALEKAIAANISVIVFPSHCTHVLQPLDVGIFQNFKRSFKARLQAYLKEHQDIKKNKIAEFIKVAREKAFTKNCITRAFRDAGIWPLNPEAVLSSGKLSPAIALSTNQSQTVILPTFSPRFRAQVQEVIKAAGAKVSQPLMDIVEARFESAEAAAAEPIPMEADDEKKEQENGAKSLAAETEEKAEDKTNKGSGSGLHTLKSLIDKGKNVSPTQLKRLFDQFQVEEAGRILQQTHRLDKPPAAEPAKKRGKFLKSNGEPLALTEPEVLQKLKEQEEETATKKKRPRESKKQDGRSSARKKSKPAAVPTDDPVASKENAPPAKTVQENSALSLLSAEAIAQGPLAILPSPRITQPSSQSAAIPAPPQSNYVPFMGSYHNVPFPQLPSMYFVQQPPQNPTTTSPAVRV